MKMNILDHTSMKNKDEKDSLMAKVIDQEDVEIKANVEIKSQDMLETEKLNTEQTDNLIRSTWTPE